MEFDNTMTVAELVEFDNTMTVAELVLLENYDKTGVVVYSHVSFLPFLIREGRQHPFLCKFLYVFIFCMMQKWYCVAKI